MYSTPEDDREHLKEFVRQTGTGGIWPKEIRQSGYQLPGRIFLCLVFAVTSILPFLFIWQFKFGEPTLGYWLLIVFVILAFYVYRSMSLLLAEH